ncbi:hypothetical protein O181_099200 [Austropuccinia psidii MF-1]|uniref:Integrase catalytic domain-containing protein n=1 Tax=Austropuccinia psidii MF-1 TaxID=1389203 RepID=A0A9Q3JAL3_9BASI|nr:hypothetical protein [Austropuccinia psidii MF-1]
MEYHSTTFLHQLSGHPSLEYFKKMYPDKNISSFNCTTCNLRKMIKIPFKGTFPQPNCKLETIHIDLCGPISPESISGKKYFLRIVHGFPHFVWIFFLTNKSECKDYIKNHINRIEQQANSKVANLISDNGSEFKNSDLQNFFKSKGINHLTSAPYTPKQNPFAERENLTPHKSLSFETPFSKWFDKKPSQKFLHPFGCEAIYLDKFPKSKFGSRGGAGVFLGYGEGHRMFHILYSETGKVKTTHHVKFNDFVFPNKNQENLDQNTESFVVSGSLDIPNNPQTNCSEIPETPYNLELSPNDQRKNDENQNANTDTLWKYKGFSWLTEPEDNSKKIMSHIDPANILTNSCQTKQSANFAVAIVSDPKSFSQAIHHTDSKQWLAAIDNELSNMETHQVWSSHEQDKSIHLLTTTRVFKRKTDANGNLTKYKARLCVRGFNQQEGVNYDDVFSPTGQLASLRLLLMLSHQHGFQIKQMDVQCAFLNGIPHRMLYIFGSDGCKEETKMLTLKKLLYGLKQSPRFWHNALNNALLQRGLVPTKTDPCLYYLSDHSKPMWLFAHVDNLIFSGCWNEDFKAKIKTFF